MRLILWFLFFLAAIMALSGCSGNRMMPTDPINTPNIPNFERQDNSYRTLWGIWSITLDTSKLTAAIEPLRTTELHYNITPMITPPQCNDCVSLKINSFDTETRIMDIDVSLKNPTSISGYDVRGILYTDDAGHELRNADAWTGLWDIAGGGTINPFKAFAKTNPERIFAGGQKHTEKYLIYIPKPPQYATIKYAVDASYPGNCKEPYSIENFYQDEIICTAGSHGLVAVNAHDWQGDINSVELTLPEITGTPSTPLTHQGGDVWSVDVANNTGAIAGDYKAMMIATSANSGTMALYDILTIKIAEIGGAGWARTWGAPPGADGNGIAIEGEGNIYVTGVFRSKVDFDPGPGVDEHTSSGDSDDFLCKYGKSGKFQWARTWGGASWDRCNDVAADSSGNVYVIGTFQGTVDFYPGPGIENHTSNGGPDVFLSKFNASGNLQWAITWGGTGSYTDEGRAVAVDELGNIFTFGEFYGTVDFDPGIGVDEHITHGMSDIFLSKFNASGDFQWARTWGGLNEEHCYKFAADGTGNAYVTGSFSSTVDFDPGPGVDEHAPTSGKSNAYLSKFNSSGDFQWVRTWGGDESVGGEGVAAATSAIYVTGWFAGTADFDPGPPTDNHTAVANADISLSKFNASGDFQWARTWGGNNGISPDKGCNVAVDGDGNSLVTGCFWGTADFDPGAGIDERVANGGQDIFVSKFNSSGDYQWARTWGGESGDQGNDIVANTLGYSFVTGWFAGTADFDPGPGVDEHTAGIYHNVFLVKFKPDGYW